MGFEVETLKFEGPLDLMLHLIHEQQLDIFDLDKIYGQNNIAIVRFPPIKKY